jgi:hypothetical protein
VLTPLLLLFVPITPSHVVTENNNKLLPLHMPHSSLQLNSSSNTWNNNRENSKQVMCTLHNGKSDMTSIVEILN